MSDPGHWEGRVAVVTGGCSGIGRATALALGRRGVRVLCLDRQSPQGPVDEWNELQIEFLECDVTRQSQLAESLNWMATKAGGIDILVNNAGIGMPHER